jgi:hypothetical protein
MGRYKDPTDRHINAWQSAIYRHILENNRKKYNILETDFDRHYINQLFLKQNKKCHWFDIELIPSRMPRYPFQPSIDRLDNSIGYRKDNIVLCSLMANLARNQLDECGWKNVIKQFKKQIIENHNYKVDNLKFDGEQLLIF